MDELLEDIKFMSKKPESIFSKWEMAILTGKIERHIRSLNNSCYSVDEESRSKKGMHKQDILKWTYNYMQGDIKKLEALLEKVKRL